MEAYENVLYWIKIFNEVFCRYKVLKKISAEKWWYDDILKENMNINLIIIF